VILETISEIKRLTPEEKLILVGELWEDWARDVENQAIAPEILEELDRRMDEHERDPEGTTTTWEAAKARIISSRQ